MYTFLDTCREAKAQFTHPFNQLVFVFYGLQARIDNKIHPNEDKVIKRLNK